LELDHILSMTSLVNFIANSRVAKLHPPTRPTTSPPTHNGPLSPHGHTQAPFLSASAGTTFKGQGQDVGAGWGAAPHACPVLPPQGTVLHLRLRKPVRTAGTGARWQQVTHTHLFCRGRLHPNGILNRDLKLGLVSYSYVTK